MELLFTTFIFNSILLEAEFNLIIYTLSQINYI